MSPLQNPSFEDASILSIILLCPAESPDAPASASAWEIFRGFSYTAPKVMDQSLDHFPESKEEDPHLQGQFGRPLQLVRICAD